MLNKRILVLMFLLAFLLMVGCIPSTPPVEENQAPTITSNPVLVAEVGEIYYYDVEATDPELDTLTYTLVEWPVGMIINPIGGLISWAPGSSQVGSHPVILGVSDGDLGDTQSFIVVVEAVIDPCVPPCPEPDPCEPPCPPVDENNAPIIYSTPEDKAEIGIDYVYDVNALDPDGDVLTYSLTVYPDGMTIDPVTGLIDWLPCSTQIGHNDVTVVVSDGDKTDTQSFVIYVEPISIVIDGSTLDWNSVLKTTIHIAGAMGDVEVLATVDYLYVLFVAADINDARTSYLNEVGNDQISINVNPTDGGSWGFPYDLIFETSALSGGCLGSPEDGGHHCLPWNPKINSGTSDNWATRWFPNDFQESLPVDLETMTLYDTVNRITEWKLPLASLNLSCGDHIKVGGAVDVGDGNSYIYPNWLNWSDVLTFVEIHVY